MLCLFFLYAMKCFLDVRECFLVPGSISWVNISISGCQVLFPGFTISASARERIMGAREEVYFNRFEKVAVFGRGLLR